MNRRIRKKRNQHKPNGTTYTQHRKNIKIIKRIVRLTKKRARIISFSVRGHRLSNEDTRNSEMLADQYIDFRETFEDFEKLLTRKEDN